MKINFLPHYKHRMISHDFNNYVREQDCRENIEKAYEQGRADEREAILGLVDWKAEQDVFKRKIDIHIDFAEILTTENVLRIITEQLKQLEEQKK